jgi:adenosine deaminase
MKMIDPHVHLGGSIPPSFVWKTIKEQQAWHLAETETDVIEAMTFAPTERRDFHRFLDKFRILDQIDWTPELIKDSIKAVCDDIAAQGLDHVWMDFSINKYMDAGVKWHKHEMVKYIYDCFEECLPGKVGLILSIKYESLEASQRKYAKLIEHEIAAQCLIGIDLVGNEDYFDADFYAPIFKAWSAEGKMTRAHVGESGHADNVRKAIEVMGVTNVAHGFKIHDYDCLCDLAKERNVTFDMAITSNYITGTWTDPTCHPSLAMLRRGLRVTLGSDDPVQCGTTLAKEYKIARSLGWTDEDVELSQWFAADNVRRFYNG